MNVQFGSRKVKQIDSLVATLIDINYAGIATVISQAAFPLYQKVNKSSLVYMKFMELSIFSIKFTASLNETVSF